MSLQVKDIVGQGIYTVPDAVKLTGVSAPNIYNWLYGGSVSNYVKSKQQRHPALAHQYDPIGKIANVSFYDLIQIRFVSYFREKGVSLQTIRRSVDNAAALLSTSHPLCSVRFKTGGGALLAEVFESNGDSNLVELHSMQQVFREVVDPFLTTLDYDHGHVSKWWHDLGNRKVVLDPDCNFGKPTVAECGYPTETLFEAFMANGRSAATVADWFEIRESEVEEAVDFELRLAA
jgi:uncharacterized protein (DUF433 family)